LDIESILRSVTEIKLSSQGWKKARGYLKPLSTAESKMSWQNRCLEIRLRT
jgi:hypothetical protein